MKYKKGFQFPSNGKVFLNRFLNVSLLIVVTVSIPFKREGLSERDEQSNNHPDAARFQFPSNGKVFLNDGDRGCKGVC